MLTLTDLEEAGLGARPSPAWNGDQPWPATWNHPRRLDCRFVAHSLIKWGRRYRRSYV